MEEKSTEDSIDDFVPLPPSNEFEGSKAAQELLQDPDFRRALGLDKPPKPSR